MTAATSPALTESPDLHGAFPGLSDEQIAALMRVVSRYLASGSRTRGRSTCSRTARSVRLGTVHARLSVAAR
jgi:hypothetical protein